MKFYSRDLQKAYNMCDELMQIMHTRPEVTARVADIIKAISTADGEMEDMHYEIKNSLIRVGG